MSCPNNQQGSTALFSWDESGRPISKRFNDFYFSTAKGIEESRHIFLANNQLAERWQDLAPDSTFTIAETGFGCGLNFLCSWQLWQQQAPEGAQLHYISTEQFPLSRTELASVFALWPELAELSTQLLALYPASNIGTHRVHFQSNNVSLSLLLGDTQTMLDQFIGSVDCWFLDGFSPDRNPQMWQPPLFKRMAQLSKPGATFSTYTVARDVRQNLSNAGFEVSKVDGFGDKKEISCGYLNTPTTDSHYRSPWLSQPGADSDSRHVTIIGGGLAGCSAALAMARRGWLVTVLERHKEPANEASGNPQGILYNKLSANGTLLSQLVHEGFHYSLGLLQQLLPPQQHPQAWSPCGVIQLAHNDKELARQQALVSSQLAHQDFFSFLDPQQLSAIAGVTVTQPGLYFPNAGWVNPASFCSAILQHPKITLLTDWSLHRLDREPGHENWTLTSDHGDSINTDVVILAGGKETNTLTQSRYLPLKAIRGQISYLPETARSADLHSVLCAEGYIAPARDGRHNFGATFNFDSMSRTCRTGDHQDNLLKLHKLSTDLYQKLNATLDNLQGGRANFRTTTADYLPLVGALVDQRQFSERFAKLSKDANYRFRDDCPFLPGIYVTTAHGSRGLTSCPLSGEILASLICNEPLPVSVKLFDALNPNRFLVRQLIRKQQ